MLHDGYSGGDEEGLHDVLVHAGGGAEDSCADVWNVGEFEQALDRAIFAEGSVEHGEDHVYIDGAVGGAAQHGGIGLERDQSAVTMNRLGRNHDGFSASEDGGGFSILRIAGAQVTRLEHKLAGQKILGVLGGQPASVFGDADGDDFVLVFIDCVENRGGGEERDFVLSTAAAEKDTNP